MQDIMSSWFFSPPFFKHTNQEKKWVLDKNKLHRLLLSLLCYVAYFHFQIFFRGRYFFCLYYFYCSLVGAAVQNKASRASVHNSKIIITFKQNKNKIKINQSTFAEKKTHTSKQTKCVFHLWFPFLLLTWNLIESMSRLIIFLRNSVTSACKRFVTPLMKHYKIDALATTTKTTLWSNPVFNERYKAVA